MHKVHLEVHKMHLEGSQMRKSASGGTLSASGGAQMAVLAAQRAVLTAKGRCPRGGKYVRAEPISPHEYGDSGPLSSAQGDLLRYHQLVNKKTQESRAPLWAKPRYLPKGSESSNHHHLRVLGEPSPPPSC